MSFGKATKKIAAVLLCLVCMLLCQSCTGAGNASENSEMTADRKKFMKIAPDEIKQLKEFDILFSDKYFVQIKITYLMSDMRMRISRDGEKYDIFTETAKTYSHNIIKDGLDYKLQDEKKTYSVSEAKQDVNVSFLELNGDFVYKGVSEKEFNKEKAFFYKFRHSDGNESSEMTFAVKDKKLKGIIITSSGSETKMTIEGISKELPETAFVIPTDYKKT